MEKLMQVNNELLLRKIALEVHDLYIQENVDSFKLKQKADLSHNLSMISVKMYIRDLNIYKHFFEIASQIVLARQHKALGNQQAIGYYQLAAIN